MSSKPQSSDLLKHRKIILMQSRSKEDKKEIEKNFDNMLLLRTPYDKNSIIKG